MSKILEALRPELYEGSNKVKTKRTHTEKSRDYYNVYPGTKTTRPFLSEEEYMEVHETHNES